MKVFARVLRSTPLRLALLLGWAAAAQSVGAQDTITGEQAERLINEIRELRQTIDSLRTPPTARPNLKVRLNLLSPHVLGRADAPVTLVEFTDLECAYCRAFHVGTFERIKQEYIDTGKVRFLSLDFPLKNHPNARPAAQAVRCAGEQKAFWQMRHFVTLNANALSRGLYLDLARRTGLDAEKLDACIESDRYKVDIDREQAEGLRLGVTGTPTFVLGRTTPGDTLEGQRIVGAQPYAVFEAQIKALLGEP